MLIIAFMQFFIFISVLPQHFSYNSYMAHQNKLCMITWLCMHWSPGWSCTDHLADHALMTGLIMHWSRSWSYTDHVTLHDLITWLIMHWSPGWLCSDNLAIIHWSLDWSCTLHLPYHALMTWLTVLWSRSWSYIKWKNREIGSWWARTSHFSFSG